MSYAVVLKGGPPWGFRIQGGREFNEPITVAKVRILLILNCHLIDLVQSLKTEFTGEPERIFVNRYNLQAGWTNNLNQHIH